MQWLRGLRRPMPANPRLRWAAASIGGALLHEPFSPHFTYCSIMGGKLSREIKRVHITITRRGVCSSPAL